MADDEKSREVADPEKVTELSRNTTYGEGETKEGAFIHADPNDGDEAFVALFFSFSSLSPRARLPALGAPPPLNIPIFPPLPVPAPS
jgi:hypothetical protein